MSPRVFSSLETVTVSYQNCDNFITKGLFNSIKSGWDEPHKCAEVRAHTAILSFPLNLKIESKIRIVLPVYRKKLKQKAANKTNNTRL